MKFVLWFDEIRKEDGPLVGGKNASLGEMISRTKVPVPPGFAITSHAYWHFINENGLQDFIKEKLQNLDKRNIEALRKTGEEIRKAIRESPMPVELEEKILEYYDELSRRLSIRNPHVAVRSSATAEDLEDASFAGQQETYLNITREELIDKIKSCFASLFTDRAISYREDKGFEHLGIALSVGIQKMVNSQASGVMFTIDPDTGFRNYLLVESIYGLGEFIVQGKVSPDVFTVFKPTMGIIKKVLGTKEKMLVRGEVENEERDVPKEMRNRYSISDDEIRELASYGIQIEEHYGRPMDIEWAKDEDGKLYIVQARPETVHGLSEIKHIEKYSLKERSRVLLTGESIGRKIGQGEVNVIEDVKEMQKFKKGQVLVTTMTDPDWEPIMKIASAIVTDKGGRTCHAAIVSRELGIPCIVGTKKATEVLKSGQEVTVDCTGEEGKIWEGILKYEIERIELEQIPKTKTNIAVNVGIPDEALQASRLPIDGVGLARQEFIINAHIGEHPLKMIEEGREQEFVQKLAEGVASIVAPFYPREVVVRLSDFKTNEYASLRGGEKFEEPENNPMIGWRGASRYISKEYEPAFRLECRALKKVRDDFGLTNMTVMVPFCRTLNEARKVLEIMESEGLKRGENGLRVYVMAEIPSNAILAEEFAQLFDGFSIGSNDLTQLTLGIDRDNERLQAEFDERNDAVLRMISLIIRAARKYKRYVGICGEAPSYYPEIVEFLVREGITSISVNPEVAIKTKLMVAEIEEKVL